VVFQAHQEETESRGILARKDLVGLQEEMDSMESPVRKARGGYKALRAGAEKKEAPEFQVSTERTENRDSEESKDPGE